MVFKKKQIDPKEIAGKEITKEKMQELAEKTAKELLKELTTASDAELATTDNDTKKLKKQPQKQLIVRIAEKDHDLLKMLAIHTGLSMTQIISQYCAWLRSQNWRKRYALHGGINEDAKELQRSLGAKLSDLLSDV